MAQGNLLHTNMRPLIGSILLCFALLYQAAAADVLYIPKDGLVPNSKIAIQIADAILVGVFGENTIKSERPLNAELRDNVWIISGTMPKGRMGGVAYIYIAKRDAKVLRLYHEQ